MGGFKEYAEYDALGLAELVKAGEISPRELLTEARIRLDRVNTQLNAVICPMDALADSLIPALDGTGIFSGVPFLAKDFLLSFAGYPLSNGSAAMKGYIPTAHNELAKRLCAVGLIPFGKTNTAELGATFLTKPTAFGATRNPWNPSRNAGGSSGGSSAAVAARVVPMAYSNDGGGSIRIPASYCGIFGFKPSRGLNRFEDLSQNWGGGAVSHVSTVSVRDSAAYLDVVSGHDSATVSSSSSASYLHAVTQPLERIRIGLITQAPTKTRVHADCVQAARVAAEYCENLGHMVEETQWNFDGMALMRAFLTVVFHAVHKDVGRMATLMNVKQNKIQIELQTKFLAAVGAGIREEQVRQALFVWQSAAKKMAELHRDYDVILTPTVATPPLSNDALEPLAFEKLMMQMLISSGMSQWLLNNNFLDSAIHKSIRHTPFTGVANMTGQPAMSVPLFWSDEGLPLGAQFMAAEGHDKLLFQLAGQLESAHPWKHRMPGICS